MSPRYGFYLDTAACTGCKACQISCKDKNQLPVGVLWRRVIEVSGGSWQARQGAWFSSVRAYFVSSACMHCENPICVEVCPTQAMSQREDGIVLIDEERCIGCRYCEMACPYKAPQFDCAKGVMTKCDFCYDLLDQGEPPACVSACQMRVLHYGDLSAIRARYGQVNDIYPLPDPGLTQPAIVFTPHPDSVRWHGNGMDITNREEI
jgi:anaerobic dimethyl sulfoxide reductase subunit B (iron-sulfur subunit)